MFIFLISILVIIFLVLFLFLREVGKVISMIEEYEMEDDYYVYPYTKNNDGFNSFNGEDDDNY